jgi:hypothetical protein
MSKAFQPGDLALTLVYDAQIPAGSQVELAIFLPKGSLIDYGQGISRTPTDGWVCKHPAVPNGVAYGVGELMPLRDDDLPAETLDTAAPRELVSA